MPSAGEVIAWDFQRSGERAIPSRCVSSHALHDIHERIKLFVLVKTKHLEAS
jgi:ArsR family transcriptional regulator, arsenate/arsenite/antimonite-responsive transcriptional repressor / arsenate reductase (thioredoxin)